MDKRESDYTADGDVAEQPRIARQRRNTATTLSSIGDHSVKIFVVGKDKESVSKAVDALKKRFSESCTTQKVENETVSKLSPKQVNTLRKKAKERDVRLEIEVDVDRIVVKGGPVEVPGMVGRFGRRLTREIRRYRRRSRR